VTDVNPRAVKVLLVNDDGIDAPGIQALRHEIDPVCDLLVVAPMSERSGAGCSLSLNHEMAVERRLDGDRHWGWAVDGTPADCVKFALTALGGYRPDIVLSGINRGRNVGNSIWYSGTVAGAFEATMFGLRAMAVSLAAFRAPVNHFESAAILTRRLLPWLVTQQWKPRTLYNLNVPNLPYQELKGVRVAVQGTSFFADEFQLNREEGGTLYYRNVGEHLVLSPEPNNSDDRLVDANHPALSMLSMDLTVPMPEAAGEALEREWNQLAFGQPGVHEPGTGR
jgi:5'-nucleotidase